ncbi:MAG: transglutaminase domain-containing protein [Sedimentisphaerales bacterium]|nr:transglutaminase domain-containing protein [Sedimentisphaerales bacterium]
MKTRILASALVVILWSAFAWAKAEKAGSINLPQIDYYAVLMDGAKVGYAARSRIVSDGQVLTTEFLEIAMRRMAVEVSVRSTETCVETMKGEPLSFTSVLDIGIVEMRTEGTVGKDGVVRASTNGCEGARETTFPWPQGAVMSEGLRLLEVEKGLKEGTSYSFKMFVPNLLSAIDVNEQVGGKEEVDLFGRAATLTKVVQTMRAPGTGETTTISFVDNEFKHLKMHMPVLGMQVDMITCEKEVALGGNEWFDIGDKMFLASPEPITDAGGARAIAYSLKPTKPNGSLIIPAGDNQRVQKLEDGSMIVVVEPASMPRGGKFPYKGNDKDIVEATKPNRFLQSDDARVIELAKRAVGDTRDAGEAARRIEKFVGDYVESKSLSVGYASASEVAASRKGDCSEFAVLCAAMCRSAGIPARMVFGVAYVEDFMGRSGFGGHAWVEAYVGDKWVGLDPMFKSSGRGGFDAGHLAMASGDGEPVDFFNVAATLGRFKIEKIVVDKGK